jgi:hypothetical protein
MTGWTAVTAVLGELRRSIGGDMYASNLQEILFRLCQKSELSPQAFAEFTDRFNSLRGYGLLPLGRERREVELTDKQIASAVLGVVSTRSGWAGHTALLLADLRPVGGVEASFYGATNVADAIATTLSSAEARKNFIRLTLGVGETGTNSSGGAMLTHKLNDEKKIVHFVPKLATSLQQAGAEHNYDPDKRLLSPASREMSFNHSFFAKLARECEIAKRFPAAPIGDGSEYDEEEARQARNKKLRVTRNSRFLNVGVDNQVTWPKEETLVKFDRYHLVTMPKTKDNIQSIHIDLTANSVDQQTASTIINRFLSIMTWCDDQFAVAGDGWSGNPVPVPVPHPNLAFTTAYDWVFDRKLPASDEARRALALYREARNAEQNYLVSYAVLNYYKIIELRHNKNDIKNWIRDNFDHVVNISYESEALKRFDKIRGTTTPHEYIHSSCRIAVAHAGKHSKSDPDESSEITRLHAAANIMRLLARHFIITEFAISDSMYSGE